jgi:hypothetical protein
MRHGWSLNENDWNKLQSLPITGKWKRVPFNKNEAMRVAETSGVYMITARVPGSTTWPSPTADNPIKSLLAPVYIGMDRKSMRRRFMEHLTQPSVRMILLKHCYASSDMEYWYIGLTPGQTTEVERVLIAAMGPSGNQRQGILTATPRVQ